MNVLGPCDQFHHADVTSFLLVDLQASSLWSHKTREIKGQVHYFLSRSYHSILVSI